jgi:hypothetical protein
MDKCTECGKELVYLNARYHRIYCPDCCVINGVKGGVPVVPLKVTVTVPECEHCKTVVNVHAFKGRYFCVTCYAELTTFK